MLDGTISMESTGSITIDGDNSFGIFVEKTASITGDLNDAGTIVMTGNNTVGIQLAGAVGGNVTISGAISASGVGSRGLVHQRRRSADSC